MTVLAPLDNILKKGDKNFMRKKKWFLVSVCRSRGVLMLWFCSWVTQLTSLASRLTSWNEIKSVLLWLKGALKSSTGDTHLYID